MSRSRVLEELPRLRAAGLPRLDYAQILTITGELADEDRAALTEYFRHFVAPLPGGDCICCGNPQGGMWAMFGLGFVWGVVHGEGSCARCGWPARAYHFDVGPIKRLSIILQYHPDEIRPRTEVSV